MLAYMVVRKTKEQATAGLNTGFHAKLAREKLDGLKRTHKAFFPAAESRLPDDNIVLWLYFFGPQDKEAGACRR
jgi:hypothetical protein